MDRSHWEWQKSSSYLQNCNRGRRALQTVDFGWKEMVRWTTGHNENNSKPIVSHGANIYLKPVYLSTLSEKEWLNDEIVNSFVFLLNNRNNKYFHRSSQGPDTPRTSFPAKSVSGSLGYGSRSRTYIFSSYFSARLTSTPSGYDYAGVRNRPKQAGIN